jgi:HSP20 family protein
MSEVRVIKEPKTEYSGTPWFGLDIFRTAPLALRKHFFTEEIDRMFGLKAGTAPVEAWRPAIEVKQEEGKLLVTAELPGVNGGDVKVYVTGDALVVEGERKYEKEEKREGYFHTERSYGRFYRAIPIPDGANADNATANFNNGVLNVVIPFPEILPKAREIVVTEGAPAKATTTH